MIDVWNKADAAPHAAPADGIVLSAKTGLGLDSLRSALLAAAGWQAPSGGVFIARERHIHALRRVDQNLAMASEHLAAQDQSLDLLAEELRLGQNALSEITGEFTRTTCLASSFPNFALASSWHTLFWSCFLKAQKNVTLKLVCQETTLRSASVHGELWSGPC